MSIIVGRDGYYDDNGHWQRTKLCTVPCPNCTCKPPGGMWVIPVKKKNEDNEMTTRNAQKESNNDS